MRRVFLIFCSLSSFFIGSTNPKMFHYAKYVMSSKSIETEAIFIKTEINNKRRLIFLKIQTVLKKYIKTEAVFTQKEMNNVRNVNFLQNTS